jgi:polar amino acid transport system substrate-binding protein
MSAPFARRFVALGFALVLPAALAACSSSDAAEKSVTTAKNPALFELLPAAMKESKTIKVGVSPNSPPLLRAEGEKTIGIIPDLAKEVEQILGIKLEMVPMDYAGLVPALQSDRIDLNWSVINDTEERQKTMDFVDFLRSDHGFLVLKGNPKNIVSAEALCGTRAGTVKGGLDQAFLEEQQVKCKEAGMPEMELKLYNNRQDIQTAMQSGKVDAFLGIRPSHLYQAQTVKDGTVFEVAPGDYIPGIFGMALTKKNTGLRDALQGAIKQTVREGTYGKILEKYDLVDAGLTEDQILINGVGNGL